MNALVAAMALLSAAPDMAERPLRRFLLAISSEDGGPGKARLRYSASDARGVARVMQQLGGVEPARTTFLTDPDSGQFLSGFRSLAEAMERSRDSGHRVEFMAYYSGHSDEQALLLGSTRIPYSRLRQTLQTAPAEVRLAVLDACASGAAVRSKGGVRREAFRIEGADRLRGQAFLTSSRAEEASHESDRIGGSFFTQAFVAGLQGAADIDRDRKVTLLEAYRYAYDRTVANTSSTRTGPQHPEFDLDLSGSGEVVLTDLDQTGSVLGLGASVAGRVTVVDSTGATVVDLTKEAGFPLDLGLRAGPYRIGVVGDSTVRHARVVLPRKGRTDFVPSDADSLARIVVASVPSAGPESVAPKDLVLLPVNLGIFAPISINSLHPGRAWNLFSLDVFGGETERVDGLQIGSFYARARRLNGVQIGLVGRADSLRGLQVGGLASWSDHGGTGVQVGLAKYSGGPLVGAQLGLVDIVSGPLTGLQAGLVDVVTSDLRGAQLGLVNWANGSHGAQLGLASATRGMGGVQLSVLNVGGSVTGSQVGVVNWAGSIKGAQVGVLNLAGSSHGLQAGVLNLSRRARGAVVGVLNGSQDLDALPVGILSAGLNMRPGLEVGVDECGYGTVFLRLDGRRFHTRVGGIAAIEEPEERLGYAFGFGAHWEIPRAWILEGDLVQRQVWHDPSEAGPFSHANWSSAVLSMGRDLGPATVSGGISFNVLQAYEGEADAFTTTFASSPYRPGSTTRIWPGTSLSIRF